MAAATVRGSIQPLFRHGLVYHIHS